jgi:hypothetical protein
MVPERFCADKINDQPRSQHPDDDVDNHGSIRTVTHLKRQAWIKAAKMQFSKFASIMSVASKLENFDGAYLLLDEGLDYEILFMKYVTN